MKKSILLISAVLVTVVAIGGTIAWLTDSKSISNSFSLGNISCDVEEVLEDNVKKDIKVKNIGNARAYVRVNIVTSWVDKMGNILPKNVTNQDCEILFSDSDDWFKGKDGYYYYKKSIAPGEQTSVLIDSATVSNDETDVIRLDILASAIQVTPKEAVEESWNVYVNSQGELQEVQE